MPVGSFLINFGDGAALLASDTVLLDLSIFFVECGSGGVFDINVFGFMPLIFCSACNWAGFNTAGLELFSELNVELTDVTD